MFILNFICICEVIGFMYHESKSGCEGKIWESVCEGLGFARLKCFSLWIRLRCVKMVLEDKLMRLQKH